MPARVLRLPTSTSRGPLSQIATRVAREVKLWRWRRERSQIGAPVTIPRSRSGRAFTFHSRHADSRPGL